MMRRNLIIVFGHGLRSDALGDSRVWPLQTPNLERLVQQGLRLIATSACPSDSGGFVSLLTALHARQHGHLDKSGDTVVCDGWARQLVESGYHLAGVGRIGPIESHLHQAVRVDDVERVESPRCAYLAAMRINGQLRALQQQRRQRLRHGPFEPDRLLIEPDNDVDGFIACHAERVLARMPEDKPWAMVVIFTGPGNDLPPPPPYDQVVGAATVEPGFMPADIRLLDALAELDYPRVLLQRLEPSKLGQIRADYLGRVSLFDDAVGRLSKALAQRPDRDRCWLVLSSDRGCLLGEHGLVGHRSFLAPALEVPVLIVPPASASWDADLVPQGISSTVDVAATIAALGCCDLPRCVAARPLMPTLGGDPSQNPAPGGAISEFGRRLMFETERHKVVFDTETRHAIGLYDMLTGPDEKQNLVETMTGRNVLDSLRWRLCDVLMALRAAPGYLDDHGQTSRKSGSA